MTVTTNEFGQQNLFAKEPQMVVESYNRKGLESPQQYVETYNGRWAMMGIVSGFISYAFTGNFFFGIFWWLKQFSPSLQLHFSCFCPILYNNSLKPSDGKLPSWNSYLLHYWRSIAGRCPWDLFSNCIHACSSKYEGSHGRLQRPQDLWRFFYLREHSRRFVKVLPWTFSVIYTK